MVDVIKEHGDHVITTQKLSISYPGLVGFNPKNDGQSIAVHHPMMKNRGIMLLRHGKLGSSKH